MMDGTFIEELHKHFATPGIRLVNGRERLCLPSAWVDATPRQPEVDPLKVGTLTGLVYYLRKNVDELALAGLMIHVVSPTTVSLRAKIEDESAQYRRQTYLIATTEMCGAGFPFGQYLDAETFVIGLQSQFVQTQQRDEILTLVASIRENSVRDTVDSGVSQMVTTAGGVVLVGSAKVPSPVSLRPFRTFREVEQPESLFLLRLKSAKDGEKPLCALIEADGGAWKLAAVKEIATYLASHLDTHGVAILA